MLAVFTKLFRSLPLALFLALLPMAEGEEYHGPQSDEGWEVPRDTGAGSGLFH